MTSVDIEFVHLYAPPGDWPDTLCPRGRAWTKAYTAVYPKDLALVTCPVCIKKYGPQHASAGPTPRRRAPDLVRVMCGVVVATFLLLAYLWWMST